MDYSFVFTPVKTKKLPPEINLYLGSYAKNSPRSWKGFLVRGSCKFSQRESANSESGGPVERFSVLQPLIY